MGKDNIAPYMNYFKGTSTYLDIYIQMCDFFKSSYFIIKCSKKLERALMFCSIFCHSFKKRCYFVKIVIFSEGAECLQSFKSNYVYFTSGSSSK